MKDEDLINSIRIAAPCPVSWDTMTGDEKVRFCSMCKLNVYNISNMSASEAANLIRENQGKLCAQILRRRDGTVITENCPVGLRKIRNAARRCAVAATALLCWFGFSVQSAIAQEPPGQMVAEPMNEAQCDASTTARLGGAIAVDPAWTARMEQEERAKKSAWLLVFPALLSMLALFVSRKKRNRSITRMGFVLASVVGVSGFIWGLYVMGALPWR